MNCVFVCVCACLCACVRTEDYAVMCNLRRPGGADRELRERPPAQYEYSPEGSEAPLEPFVSPYWDNYGGGPLPEGTYYNPGVPQGVPLFNDYSPREPPARVPVLRPREFQPRPLRPHTGGCRLPGSWVDWFRADGASQCCWGRTGTQRDPHLYPTWSLVLKYR